MEVGGHFIAENVSTKDSLFTRKEAILKGKQKHNQLTMRRLPLNIKDEHEKRHVHIGLGHIYAICLQYDRNRD